MLNRLSKYQAMFAVEDDKVRRLKTEACRAVININTLVRLFFNKHDNNNAVVVGWKQ